MAMLRTASDRDLNVLITGLENIRMLMTAQEKHVNMCNTINILFTYFS